MSSRFIDALLGAASPVIMEVKRSDGNDADLLRGRTPAVMVAEYERVGAPCLSVVTGSWFRGDDELLRSVAACTDRPVLQKDFITGSSQIVAARELGAAAVLLTAELLPATLLRRLTETCLRRGLTPFVEVATSDQLEAVVHGEECVVAVNNKDICRRERGAADLDRSLSLLADARATGARCVASASGITTPQAGARLLDAGFDALLVGTALLLAPDVGAWVGGLARHRGRAAFPN
jgi:indole-3-glycerol phosphate synthase